jgi:EmrB/QacA subfamily drug resistance transporter
MLSRLQYKYLVAIVYIFGLFMDMLDSTAVNVAVPQLTLDFHTQLSTVEWTVTGYLLSLAVFIPGSGFIADRYGTKRTFLTAMGIFVIGSALCGQAHSIEQLIAFRFLQGIGGGMMTPVSTVILSREFPGEERAKAAAIMAVPVVFAPLAGPVLSGYLVQYQSWRWIFYINLPIGLIGLLLGSKVLREHKEPYAQGRFDILGLISGGAGAAMVLYALSEAATLPWTSATVAGWGLGGLAVLGVFAVLELHRAAPLLDLRLFKQTLFVLGNAMSVGAFAGFSGFLFLLTLFLQDLQGRSPLHAALIQAPSALGTAISLPLASRLYPRVGPRRMMLIGFGLGGLTLLPFATLDQNSGPWLMVVLLALRGLPFAFAMVAVQTIVFGPIDNAKQGPASSIYNTVRQVGASFGVALVATVQISRAIHNTPAALRTTCAQNAHAAAACVHAQVLGYHDAFIASCALLIVSFGAAFFISDEKARASMRKRVERMAGHGEGRPAAAVAAHEAAGGS